jgi:hypothetical protein
MNNTYCSKSWTDINIDFENRTVRHCCKTIPHDFPKELTEDFISNNDRIKERRKQSLEGIKHEDCNSCWADYDIGKSAYRDWANRWDEKFLKSNKIGETDEFVYYIEIKPDRICDMSCIYCSAYSSSKIAQEEKIIYLDKTDQNDYQIFRSWISKFLSREDLKSNQIFFIFLGGEPTASERFYQLTDYIESQAENYKHLEIRLEICTNANSKKFLMNKIIDRIDRSRLKWAIGISNESYGQDSELIRHGLSWTRFQENFRRYIQHPKTELIVLSPTINIFNLKTFGRYIEWVFSQFKDFAPDKEFSWFGNFINGPTEMDIASLPISYRKYIEDAEQILLEHRRVNQWVYQENFLEFTKQMKIRIGQNYNENYKVNAQKFLEKKQAIKKTDILLDLMKTLDL